MSPIEHINSCRLRPHRGESFAYDAEGNLTQRTGPSGTVNYTWNALGQLVTVASSQGTVTTYGYDGWGQRVRKSVNSVITRYLLHNANVVMEIDAYNGILAEYTYYPGADRPHGMRRGGVQYYYAQDAEGNVRGLINTAGAVVASYDYSPQGELVGSTGSVTNPYRYKGREWDAEAGLYFMRARYYDPKVARFVSEDPIGVAGGLSLYAFGGGDPVNYSDPSGLDRCSPEAVMNGYGSDYIEGKWECVKLGPQEPIIILAYGGGARIPFGFGRGVAAGVPYVSGTGGGWDGPANKAISYKSVACAKEQLGITTVVGAGAVVVGQPIIRKPFSAGGSEGTSIASKGLAKLLPRKLSHGIWAPTTRNVFAQTPVVGRAAGRWVPLVGWALLAKDAYDVSSCISDFGGSRTF